MAHYFINLRGILSGPGDLLGFSTKNWRRTSCSIRGARKNVSHIFIFQICRKVLCGSFDIRSKFLSNFTEVIVKSIGNFYIVGYFLSVYYQFLKSLIRFVLLFIYGLAE